MILLQQQQKQFFIKFKKKIYIQTKSLKHRFYLKRFVWFIFTFIFLGFFLRNNTFTIIYIKNIFLLTCYWSGSHQ